VPLLCVDDFSVKCGMGKTEKRTVIQYGWPEPVRLGEFPTHF
jgi:hypothetical protein